MRLRLAPLDSRLAQRRLRYRIQLSRPDVCEDLGYGALVRSLRVARRVQVDGAHRDVERRAGLGHKDPSHLPAVQRPLRQTMSLASEGNGPDDALGERVGPIEASHTAVYRNIRGRVDRRGGGRVIAIIDCSRKGVTGVDKKAIAEAAIEFDLK